MKLTRISMLALLLTVLFAGPLPAQDKIPVDDERARQRRVEETQAHAERMARAYAVQQLTERAAALRLEFNFEEAARVEDEIRDLCRENDPRVVRVNELMRRAGQARLAGDILDADMYEREAERVLAELKVEYVEGANPAHDSSSRVLGNPMISQSTIEEIADLRERVVALTNEVYRLTREVQNRDQLLSQLQADHRDADRRDAPDGEVHVD